MQSEADPEIQAFFEKFQKHNASGEAQDLVSLYAPVFLMAGASGSQTVKAADLLQAIPKRKQMLKSIGHRSTTLVSLQETALDGRYSLVRTGWRWQFDRAGDAPWEITVPSTMILERSVDGLKIVFYLNHQDIMTVLRQRGLLS